MDSQSQAKPASTAPSGRPVGSLGARGRRQQLVAAYVEALGGKARVTAIQLQDITRAVDLVTLASKARAALAAGNATINDVVKLEGAADRAVRRLGLPPPNAAPPVPSLAEYLAQLDANAPEAGDT
jgi:hypothetical protein